jgi:hypothetical protein
MATDVGSISGRWQRRVRAAVATRVAPARSRWTRRRRRRRWPADYAPELTIWTLDREMVDDALGRDWP